MRKKVVNSNIAFILALIILIVVGILIFINFNEKDKYENEGINMTEEEKVIVNEVIKLAEEKIGLEYVWGGKGEIMTEERLDELIGYYGDKYYPLKKETYIGNQAFDCSGLTYWTYREVTGVEIGYSTFEQEDILQGYEVSEEDLQPGDLIYTPGHVVLYKGRGEIINAYNKLPYPIGGVKSGKLYLGDDSVIYRPFDYIKSLE
ncbi:MULTISPECIES: NlpC/P60 family protein [Clostridium]|jgi:cell wall-associated NlpC family hydrolase|uniref:C40 family peptidase n=1 Tax=Clostridium TaxID=1485 RepID=UPI00062E820D|nr:NlpC/P60 family protein [Clostridium sp. C8]KLE14550.1 NLP/P60 family protein, enterotoxin [Clostridium sp. C8]